MNNQFAIIRKTTIFFLCASMASAMLASCSDTEKEQENTNAVSASVTTPAETDTQEIRDTRFDGVDFAGREFRVLSSFDDHDATNAHLLIAGTGETNGDPVNDTVFRRNEEVSNLLNIKLVFTPTDYTFDTCESNIRKLVLAGDDLYDVMINDIRSLAKLSAEGVFQNVADEKNFDYTQKYWYRDCMDDLILREGHEYILAGDYFMDVIGSCHALFYNKEMAAALYDDAEYLYKLVSDGKWTYDIMAKICEETYQDINGDGKENEGDTFGIAFQGTWGCAIPFVGSSGIQFINRSSGTPELDFNNERSVKYLEALNHVFWNTGALQGIKNNENMSEGLRQLFGSGQTLLLAYNRLGDLAKMRDIKFDIGVIPYPKLEETDEYVTSMHDTSEIGAIPITSTDMNFVTTVIEVANRETSKLLMPEYYESALKVKYTTDTMSAQMIDLIHDSFGSSFPLAYDQALNGIMLQSFTDPLGRKSVDFASQYAKKEKKAIAALEKLIEQIDTLDD